MLDSSNKIPLYSQLVSTLLKQIQDELHPNDKLPSEKEICEEYCVSRTTVRLAMNELEKMGYIYRIQGKGSFVASVKKHLNSFFNLSLNEHYTGIDNSALNFKIYDIKKEEAPLFLCHQMGLLHEKNILRLQIIHYLDKKPICLEKIVLRQQYFRFITNDTFNAETIDSLIQKQGIKLKAAEENYRLGKLTNDEINLIHCNPENILVLTKSLYNDANELVIMSELKILSSDLIYQNFAQIN